MEKWPQQAFTTMFFVIPKNVTSERPIALMPTLIRWCEALECDGKALAQRSFESCRDALPKLKECDLEKIDEIVHGKDRSGM